MPRNSNAFEIRRHDTNDVLFRSRDAAVARDALTNAVSHAYDLSYAQLSQTEAEGYHFGSLIAPHAIFDGSMFAEASLEGASLNNASFQYCNMDACSFYRAMCAGANFRNSLLARAVFCNAILTNANFRGCDLTDADFRNADLTGADFTGANTTGANFAGAINAPNFADFRINIAVDGATIAEALPAPPPRPPRTLLDLAKQRKMRIKVVPIMGPLPLGLTFPLYEVRIHVGKKRLTATVEYAGGQPKPLQALDVLRSHSREVDNGRGDCKCGCGIVPLETYAVNRGVHRSRANQIEARHQMCVQASKVLREAFGNDARTGYNLLMRMDAHSSANLAETW